VPCFGYSGIEQKRSLVQARPDKASVLLQGISASSRHQCPFKASELPQGISAPSRHQCPFKASVPLQGISAPSRHQCPFKASVLPQGIGAKQMHGAGPVQQLGTACRSSSSIDVAVVILGGKHNREGKGSQMCRWVLWQLRRGVQGSSLFPSLGTTVKMPPAGP